MLRRLAGVPRLLVIGLLLGLVALLRGRPGKRAARRARLPRALTVGALVCALASGTIALAAGQRSGAAASRSAAPAPPQVLVVPDVRGQAYVFAKGMLEDAGFAWRVTGDVGGYAANSVASQTPLPGTRVFDTGFPTVALRLERSASYVEGGRPENGSPYGATPVELVGGGTPAAEPPRPPAFDAPGAPAESADQPTLPDRAKRLAAWLERHRAPTTKNLGHWRYEHAWIVAGARFGWWGGAQALATLVRVDRRAEALWGVGPKRRASARRALAEVRERSR